MPSYEPDTLEFISKGLDNVLPGRKIAGMLAKSYAEKTKKDINTAREEAPKTFDRVMEEETGRRKGAVSEWKQGNRNIVRTAIGMEREPEEFVPNIALEEDSFGKNSAGLPPLKPKLFGNKQAEYKKGGKVTASSRADGVAQRGKTRGKMC